MQSEVRPSRQQAKTLVTDKSVGKASWPADHIQRWPIGRLVPYARNARTHSDMQISQIAASIREWGWTNPVLVAEDGTIIAGHGRVLAAQKLRIAQVPVMVATGWSEAQRRAYTIADNKLTLNGGWDQELLGLEIGELEVLGFDLDLIGFSDDERALLAARPTDGLTDPDVVPDLPSHPVTRPGDLWVLGGHRLICGDSTSSEDASRLLAGVNPHLMVTDPPYGVSYDPTWRKRAGVNLKANAQVAGFLFNAAKSGNVTAQIFWLKTRAKWRETPMELKHSGSIGRRDLSEVSDEELLNMISTLSAEVGLAPAKTIDMEPDPSSTERPEGNVLRLMPKN
jgi:ParB-like chromosome segregation protein Spo0J